MAKTIISANLNVYGNAGQFETDRSTWGFADTGTHVLTRSGVEKTAGLYSALVNRPALSDTVIMPCAWVGVIGKKYLIKAKLKTITATKLGNDGDVITLTSSLDNLMFGLTEVDHIDKTVLDIKDVWDEVQIAVTATGAPVGPYYLVNLRVTGGLVNGKVYVDQFEVYEYEDTPDVIVCTLEIDNAGTIVINESAPAANDGSIDVAVTGDIGTIEYSKDGGGSWQLSSLFAGLTTGIYVMKAREQDTISCVKEYPFAVNHAAVAFDFTTLVTDESVSGAHDGAISITPTGAGGPFEYSIDAGVTWLGTNDFADLAPGLYYVAVRNAAGNAIVYLVTVGAGTIDFDKIYHSKNPITYPKAAAPGWGILTNYRLYNDVRVEDVADSGNYISKLKTELPPDVDGNVIFYSRQAFRGVFAFTPPAFNESNIIRLTDRIKRFKNYTGELTGTDTVPSALVASVADIAIYGGIDKVHFPGLNYFTDYLPSNKKFLTWAPVEKYVDRLQEDYLNFWIYGNYTSLKLQLKVYFDDDTNETAIVQTKIGCHLSELYQIPAGPANSGALLVNPAKTAVKYELCLLSQTDAVISEVRTYYINPNRHPLTRFFMFLNSLGAFETLLFTGQAEETNDVASDVIQKYLPADYSALDGEFEVNNAIINKKQSFSSGYIKNRLAKQWHEYMVDLIISPRVYDVTVGTRMPIVINSGEHKMADQNYQRYVRIATRPAYDNDSFTPAAI